MHQISFIIERLAVDRLVIDDTPLIEVLYAYIGSMIPTKIASMSKLAKDYAEKAPA
jgi:hypothetical protein